MQYRYMGRTGLKVSELCLGTQTFGWGADEPTAHRMASRFMDAGGNFFDTSNIYNEGQSETILGSWLKDQDRAQVVIASKVFFPAGKGPNDTGLTRKHIFHQIDASLRRLQTDYIDIYQTHCWDASTPLEETLRAMDDLVTMGKIRYVGASNYTPSQLMRSLMLSEKHDWARMDCLQPEYSLLVRSPEWELLPLCQEQGVGVIAWSPLAGGWLTGKYRRNQPPPSDSRAGRADRWDDLPEQRETEQYWDMVDVLVAIAEARSKTPAQVALNWVLNKPGVTAPIFGARTPEQLEQNLGCAGWSLSPEEVAQLDAASAIPLPSPYNFIARYTRTR
ncbi:MAG TPA: aldo/keto reductase [Aggregatilinea sp.]|uniref:aldo/keto reductase n=1 Tax=Aggregatilinea sp. TaxID=2806333 RepID=UPI002BE8693E|nr:aldo/keto reductase [Aggregatilinea sp.]HML20372.1 aldo/keto reductase [Aggregatilinea sp.]